MSKSDYIPKDDEGKAALFERFRDTIPSYATTLGIDPAETADQADDANWFRFLLSHSLIMRDAASQWTSYRNLALIGPGDGSIPATPATPPMPSPVPTSMPPGILIRFRELARRIKASAGYTDSIGEALGIIGPDSADPDMATLAPAIKLRTSGGQVEVIWNKGHMEAVEIQKDSGAGWGFLAIDTRPNYTDTTPFPTPAVTWKYRAIYTRDSHRIAQWSNIAEITVGG